MTPDESDADDELSQEIWTNAVEEEPGTDDLIFTVSSISTPLCVSYTLPQGEIGTLTLYDAACRRIERMNVRGSGKVDFNSALTSGVYFVRLESADLTITRKAVLLR